MSIRRKISLILLLTFVNQSCSECSKFNLNFIIEIILKRIIKKDSMTLPTETKRNEDTEILKKNKNIEYSIIGQSNCRRNIELFKIGNKGKKILLAGCFHGLEWMTYLVLIKFLNEYSNSELSNQIYVIPCMNPDGVEISLTGAKSAGKFKNLVKKIGNTNKWQANGRGIDINHNFNAGWKEVKVREIENGFKGPNHTRFGGDAPESEPETQAIVNLCRSENFDLAFAFHSQGEEIYWDFGPNTPEESKQIAEHISQLTGYSVSKPIGLAVGGGFKDWFIEEFKKPGFTLEIGKGKNPLPIEDFDSIYNKLSPFLEFLALNELH